MRKPSSSLPNLVLVLGSMLLIIQIERTSCQSINCAALTFNTLFKCLGGLDPCLDNCSPVDCTTFQAGASCECLNGRTATNENCQRNDERCGCRIDCTQLDPRAFCGNGDPATSCSLLASYCYVDCRARGGCVRPPQLQTIIASLYKDEACSLADGGVCLDPPTTAAPTTTTTTAPTTSTTAPTTAAALYSPYSTSSSTYSSIPLPMNVQGPYQAPGSYPYYLPFLYYPYSITPSQPYLAPRPSYSPLYEPERYEHKRDPRPDSRPRHLPPPRHPFEQFWHQSQPFGHSPPRSPLSQYSRRY